MAITFLNLVLLIIFHSSMTTFSLKSTTIVTDQSALLELKNHISHDPEMQFVKAREVELPDYRLSGGIPANLFKGRELQVLSISYNQLEGKLQGEIGNLSKLQCLAIDHNHFQGNASKLTLLEMSSNYFSGSIPNDLGNLRNLRFVRESLRFSSDLLWFWCNISGRIPSELGNLSSLIRVELANNKLAGSIPPTIGRLKELQGLSLEDNKLEGAFKSFDVECEVLRNIRHRNLIKIISSCSNDFDFKALVLEFMPNGSLDKWLYSDNHSLDILQSNVLLDEDMVARLSDFGIAKLLCNEDSMNQTMTMATIGYMAPGSCPLRCKMKETGQCW
ncbi:hypothetical protein F3Y22_tig00110940pilonHSYRG00003 [Hibiscus syriacus]|uniref:Serine-threonine/tyrosine-protein kinase catalytic domain-containing protein n=1 Tax=Hibiscus syriacus TaxID=106335 RepID=A0A6A2ZCI2_HIBSY|nr:hypothetical protein F3Y22_tig00110940pilonHSYRG00003 [Hibiscus syriacus]